MVEEGMQRGELYSDLDPELVAFFLDALFDRFLQAYCVAYMDSGLGLFQADEATIEAKIRDCVTLVRLGMAAGDTDAVTRGRGDAGNCSFGNGAGAASRLRQCETIDREE